MHWQALADQLFGTGHDLRAEGDFVAGTVPFDGQALTVIGTTNHAPIGVRLALAQARVVLDTIASCPGQAILLLIDTQGQQLRRHDELLGIHRAMAHLCMCIDLARRRGHRVVGLVYEQALSGGLITSGLIADACYALPEAEIRVMRLPAMARIAKLALRLDGELVFTDGSAVAWREWLAWRAGSCRSLLVKRLNGAAIERDPTQFSRKAGWACAA